MRNKLKVFAEVLVIFVMPALVLFSLNAARVLLGVTDHWAENGRINYSIWVILLGTIVNYALTLTLIYFLLRKRLTSKKGYFSRVAGLTLALGFYRILGTDASTTCDYLTGCTGELSAAELELNSIELRVSAILAVIYAGAVIGLYLKLSKAHKLK